jgi:hypothetical protein
MFSLTESPDPRHDRRPVGALARGGDVLLCLGAASWLVSFGVIEWSFPYCSSQADGPATAVFGFPLPFMRMSPVTSVTILFAPHGYLLDVVLVGGALLALGNMVRARRPSMKARPFLPGGLGAALLVTQVLWHGVLWAQGIELPVTSIAMKPYDSYSEFRPVRLDSWGRLWCTPSRWWFPDGWHPH